MSTYGYVRVSAKEQHEDRQIQAMVQFGISNSNLYIDKKSGKDFKRPKYQELMEILKKGDILVLSSIDRLGRNYRGIYRGYGTSNPGLCVGDRARQYKDQAAGGDRVSKKERSYFWETPEKITDELRKVLRIMHGAAGMPRSFWHTRFTNDIDL